MTKEKGRGSDILIVVLFAVMWGVVLLDRQVVSYVFPSIQEQYGFTNADLGAITSATSIGFGISSIIVSIFSDRAGKKKWFLIIFALIAAVFSGSMAVTTVISAIIVIRILTGVGEGPIFPLMSVVLINQTNPKRFANYQGILQIAGALATGVIGPTLVIQLVMHIDWKMTYLVTALPALLIAIIWMFVIKGENHPIGERGTATPPEEKVTLKELIPAVLSNRNVIVCLIANILFNGAFWTYISFGPTFWVNVGGIAYEGVGTLLSIMGMTGIVWCIVLPLIANRIGRKPVTVAFALLGALTLIFVGLSPGIGGRVLYAAFLGGLTFLTMLFTAIIPIESLPRKVAASASAIIMGVGELIGGTIVPRVLGSVADSYGLSTSFIIAGILCLAVGLVSLFLKETLQKNNNAGASPYGSVAEAK
jgi:predicted MFS family arabinose efflux permease